MTVVSATLEHATLSRSTEVEAIYATLIEQGIAIIPEFVDAETLSELNKEFVSIIDHGRNLGFNVIERDEAVTVAIVRNRLSVHDYPTTSDVFSSQLMVDIASAYYGGEKFALNHQIYANLNKGTKEALADLPFVPHLDKIHTLKFFIYLTDTTAENGAMGVVLASHHTNREHRLRCLETNSDFRTVNNLVGGAETRPAEAPAGTLLIFETDITHTAGHVLPGRERRVLRGHTRTTEELKKLGLYKEAIDVTS